MVKMKPKYLKSGAAIKYENGERMPRSAAAKLAMIEEMLRPPIFDERDNLIGYGKPLITEEEAKRLLDLP
jgi:hypothetical protein